MKNFALLLGALTMVGAGCALQKTNPPEAPTPVPVACTMDAKICPDGTGVGRVGPNCEFAPCPTEPAAPTTMYKPQTINDLTIQPLEVLSDSRCPADVQCVWAGTVTIKAQVSKGSRAEILILELGTTVQFGGSTITLEEVTPPKISNKTIAPTEYGFIFK